MSSGHGGNGDAGFVLKTLSIRALDKAAVRIWAPSTACLTESFRGSFPIPTLVVKTHS